MLTKVPALESFCLVAAIGVLVDFVLQITVFMAALTLDSKRIQANRADMLPCFKIRQKKEPRKAYVREAFQKYFVPFLFRGKGTEICVYTFAAIFFTFGVIGCVKLELGLN